MDRGTVLMNNLIDLSTELTREFFTNKKFKKGSVLIFQEPGKDEQTELKIVRLNRAKQICLAEPVKLYTEDDINSMKREDAEEIISKGASNV
jgi:hypothetical protein